MLILMCVSFFSQAQTAQDQNVFNNRVWKQVSISSFKKNFYDSRDKYLGSRIETDRQVVYKDKWKRVIKVFPKKVNQVNKTTKEKSKNKSSDTLVHRLRFERAENTHNVL